MEVDADTPIGRILRAPAAEAVLRRRAPDLFDADHLEVVKGFSLGVLARYAGPGWGEDLVNDVLAELRALPDPPPPARPDVARTVSAGYEGTEVAVGSATTTAPSEASRWGRLEIELHGPAHGNPFVDVELAAEVSGPGPARRVPGFYDGDGTYRVRLLAEAEGDWAWRTTSNARSLDGIEGSFTVTGTAPGAHGPALVADQFHFAHADGTPLRPIGTTCYAWIHQGDELEVQTLATLHGGPFNKLRMCVFPKSMPWNENDPDRYPFPRADDGSWDTERFDLAFFRHLEERIGQLGALGIEADLILFHPYDRWGFRDLGPDADDRYLRYLVARLAALPNVWWSLANEYDLLWEKDEADWERIGALLRDEDPYGHLRSIHNFSAFYDHGRPWVTHASIQRTERFRTTAATDEWRATWGKPVVVDECGYEGDIPFGWGNLSAEELVRLTWEGAVRGGYVGHGETYLHPDDVLWWSKGGLLHGESAARFGFLRRILEEAPAGLTPSGEGEAMGGTMATGGEGYRLVYFGVGQPRYVEHRLPGGRWRIEVVDTWAMTVTDQGEHEGQVRIDLPARPWQAVRMTRIEA